MVLELPHPIAEARARLASHVLPPLARIGPKEPDNFPFVGLVDEDGFRLQENAITRNGFSPVAVGRFTPTGSGCRLTVSFEPPVIPALFGLLCLIAATSIGIARLPRGMPWWRLFVGGPDTVFFWLFVAAALHALALGALITMGERENVRSALRRALA